MTLHTTFPRHLWPITAHLREGALWLDGHKLLDVVRQAGSPLYLYDAATFDHAVAAYRRGLRAWPGPSRLSYAAKAWLTLPTAQLLHRRGLGLDLVSEGELAMALAAGFPVAHIHLHGNNKSPRLLQLALQRGVGAIVLDNLHELALITALATEGHSPIDLWLRLNPDILAPTHHYRQTGHAGAKFGLSLEEAWEAAARIHRSPRLRLTGLHTHIGSQIFDQAPLLAAAQRLIALAAELRQAGHEIAFLCPGGGLGAPYHPDDPHLPLTPAVEGIARYCAAAWSAYHGDTALPTLVLEPGRSLIARAGVALYSVGHIRTRPGGERIIAVDGGMADNPRPALYGVRYSACLAHAPLAAPLGPARIVGPLCESGDVLIDAIDLPAARSGDILALPMSGAYHLSMASNYNAFLLPPVYWLEQGRLSLLQRRQTAADLWHRDHAFAETRP
ncbi:MAG: diaminopimelate decarboxylase [Caldilineales bacterium]|nr:diaminopimelate decarboxylase [Caldilineales bacterium]